MKQVERIHLLARADALQPLRHLLRDLIEKYEFTSENANNIVLAINEACMNIIQHAYCGCDDGEIIVQILEENKGLVIQIIDNAQHSDLSKIKSRDLEDVRPGGLGVHLIKKLMNKVEYKNMQGEVGNLLELHKTFDNKKV